MRILLAPDKFKGSFPAARVCEHLARGVARARPGAELDLLPLADGGEGTLDLVLAARGGRRVGIQVCGPLGDPVDAAYGVTGDGVAVIESALICGLTLVPPDRRDVMRATSRGVGEAIAAALDAGIRRVLLGLGGSATVDGGAGMARALGYRLLDASGAGLSGTPESLGLVECIDAAMAHPDLAAARMTALCDVEIPLLGSRGAAALFAPQKGASASQVTQLEAGLEALAGAVARWKPADPQPGAGAAGSPPSLGAAGWFGSGAAGRLPGLDAAEWAGSGAAGGLGFGAAVFAGARLEPGGPYLMDLAGFAQRAAAADLVITGEGAFDRQTTEGKIVARVLSECARLGRKAVVVAGAWDGSWPAGLAGERLVYTGKRLPGAPEWLGAANLEALGELAAGPG